MSFLTVIFSKIGVSTRFHVTAVANGESRYDTAMGQELNLGTVRFQVRATQLTNDNQ